MGFWPIRVHSGSYLHIYYKIALHVDCNLDRKVSECFLHFSSVLKYMHICWTCIIMIIGPLQDPVTWYGINYTGTQMTQWDFQNKGILTSPAWLSFVLKVPLRYLRPSIIYSVPCDRILQRAYCSTPLLRLLHWQ